MSQREKLTEFAVYYTGYIVVEAVDKYAAKEKARSEIDKDFEIGEVEKI